MKRLLFAAALCCASWAHAGLTTGFNGDFVISNWTSSPDTGSIDTAGAPETVSLTSGDDGTGDFAFTSFYIQFVTDGTVSFDWSYSSTDADPFNDPFGYVLANDPLDLLAGFGQLTTDGGPLTQSGSSTVVVAAGRYFGFAKLSDNFGGPATTVVNGLRIGLRIEVPEPGSMALLAAALVAAGATTRRRRAARRPALC